MAQNNTNLASRLRRVMKAMRWSQADLATAAGTTKQTVSRWMRDGKRGIEARYGFALADKTGFHPRWILLGDSAAEPEFPLLRAELLRHESAVVEIMRRSIRDELRRASHERK